MSHDYPRDLIGYGSRPPHPYWPGGARVAVQFVINYEEGGENCVLHADAASEACLSEMYGARPIAGRRPRNMEPAT
ncbi:allantoinase, partial [Azospirillum brasilense]|nr:allantoinase [Azospirillum brasilense]